ncbi:MAG: response regulator transcription factor [Bacillota bacterium]
MGEAAEERRIRVLIADDHAVVRTGLRMFLGTHPDVEVVGEAGSAGEVVRAAEACGPDVVLMDLVMPVEAPAGLSGSPPAAAAHGIEAIRRLRERAPQVRCLALTSFSDEDKLLPALEAGAAGYLLKDVTPDELIRAVRAVAGGQVYLSSTVAGAVVRQATRPHEPSPLDRLTAREREVLGYLAEGLSNAEIARRLYLSEATVKSHVTSILRKLEVLDRTQAALLAVRSRHP